MPYYYPRNRSRTLLRVRVAMLVTIAQGLSLELTSIKASYDARIDANYRRPLMRTTVNLDEILLAKAVKLMGSLDRSALLQESLKALIERESAKRLAKLGGSQPKLRVAPRRREAGKI
jgi:Arc/MetJ family transcription regulator